MRPVRHLHDRFSGTRLLRHLPVLLMALAGVPQGTAEVRSERIPALHGATLAGQTVDLPAALQGKVGIFVVGFSRESRVPAAAWGKHLAVDYGRSPNVLYFELPVLEEVPRLLRSMVVHAIARDVAPAAQPHFLPITSNEAQWKTVAHFAEPDAAYVFVVDSAGGICWRTSGDPTDERYGALREAVSRALAQQAPTR